MRLLFYGNLTDAVPSSTLDWDWYGKRFAVADLLQSLYVNYPKLKGKTFRVAVNQQFVETDVALTDGDEGALMPAFSGG
ncbi:MAG: MoaD/ThiS family protein [Bacteroidota bacterium]